MKANAIRLLLFLSLAFGAHAATFSVTPNIVSNDYTGLITFHMTGLSPTETVQVVQYYDFNTNGVVDASDLAVRGETVIDGQAQLINGATNINLFRDEDGVANGTITASYRFTFAPFGGNGAGSYLFRCSSPSNHFTATNLSFTVNSAPYTQMVQGTVTNNSTNIPFAVVGLIRSANNGNYIFVAGGATDANGHYTLKAPVGTYLAVAFQRGYVGNFLSFPPVVLTSNATVTANIPLIVATTSISGSIIDSTNAVLHAVPYAETSLTTTNGMVTVTVCDSNGNFNVPITPGVWIARVLAQSAGSQAYLIPDTGLDMSYDARSGPVSDATVTLKHATALIYGRVQDNQGHSVAGASLYANADFGQYNSFASSDSNGLYSMAIDAGQGTVNVQNSSDPPLNNYIWPTPQFFINNGQALSLSVTGLVATARFRGYIVTDTGTPLSDFHIVADSYEIYGAYTLATTDDNGYFDIPMFGGRWNFGFLDTLPGLIFQDVPVLSITDGVNLTNTIIARTVTGTVSGYVHDTGGQGIANLSVAVTNHVGLTNFTLHATTDTNGNYSVAVFNGSWNVSLNNNALDGLGYTEVDPTNVSVPPAGAVANFTVASVPPPQILTTGLFDATINSYYSANLEVTNGSYPTFWYLTSGTLPDGLILNIFGYISGYPTNLGLFPFTLKVQDSRGSNDVKNLSIRVVSVPPVILTAYLFDPIVGCPYTNHFQVIGGIPPYSWALADGSAPMPPGLNLATNGTISGIPSSAGFFGVTVQVTAADNSTTNGNVQIYVSAGLQIYPSPLNPGVVGVNYSGGLFVSGGAQPQTWSVVSNSLPLHLTLNPATGSITGIPAAAGISYFTLRVTDGCATIDTPTSITNYPALQITTTTLPLAPLNVDYNAQLQATGGVPPYNWYVTSGSLPFGLYLNGDGSIMGTPYIEDTYDFTIQLYDYFGNSASQVLTIIVSSKAFLDLPAVSAPNQFTFRVTGVSGQGYTLQSTPDLSNWADLFTTNAPANVFFLTDTNASDPNRFYRLKESP